MSRWSGASGRPSGATSRLGYRNLPFPLDEEPAPAFSLVTEWDLDQALGYFASWSAVQRCRDSTGTDPLPALRRALEPHWAGRPAASTGRCTCGLAGCDSTIIRDPPAARDEQMRTAAAAGSLRIRSPHDDALVEPRSKPCPDRRLCRTRHQAAARGGRGAAEAAAPAPVLPPSGLLLANFDRSVRPQDDLYRFVNGGWLARTEIPADRSNYGAFSKLADDVETNLKAIAEEAAASTAAAGTDQRMIGDFYSSFMDEARAEQLGLTPLAGELARIEAIKTRAALVDYLSHLQVLGINNPLGLVIQPDAKRPDIYTIWRTRPVSACRTGTITRTPSSPRCATSTWSTSQTCSSSRAEGRNPRGICRHGVRDAPRQGAVVAGRPARHRQGLQPVRCAGAGKLTPAIDWPRYLEMMGVAGHDSVIIGEPSYFKELSGALGDVPLAVWKDYLRVRVVDDLSPYLNAAVVERAFDFNGRTLTGTPQIRPRWKRALTEVEDLDRRHARQGLRRAVTSRRRPKRGWTIWSPTCATRSRSPSTSSTGWAPKRATRRTRSSTASR